ncbi:lipopolysaccharide biosynthesis protein [Stenotrophomonas maltophilia]|uniref:lipopolysaccharide biosynthesis protein n=1 Tax=Stenotrophomonas maltophilia TaxID=40324 RepID=UPI0013DCB0A8|nr:lipopolysaccharide biosynthesis protein [Stenotrophomonas maltophilia]
MTIAAKLRASVKNPKGLASQFSAVLFGRMLAASLQAITVFLLAKWSTVTAFGACMALLGLLTALQTLGDLGASTFVSKEVASNGRNDRVTRARRMSAFATSLISAVGILATAAWSILQSRYELLWLTPLWIWLTIERANEIDVAIYIGEKRSAVAMTSLIVRRAGTLVLMLLLTILGAEPIFAFGVASLLAGVATKVALGIKAENAPAAKESVALSEILSESKHYWMHSFSLQARNIDSSLVAVLAGTAQAGFYSLGSRLLTPLRMVPTAMATVLLPHASKSGIARYSLGRILLMTGLLGAPYLALAATWPMVIPLLFHGKFDEAIGPLQLLTVSIAFTSTTSIFSALLQGAGHGAAVSRISIATTFATILGVACGSAGWGAFGAALAYALASVLHSALIILQFTLKTNKASIT